MAFHEILLVALLTVMVGAPFYRAYRGRDPVQFWSPLTLFAAIFAYYFVLGPLLSLAFHNTFAYGINLREMMGAAWLAGALSLGSIYAGFAIKLQPHRAPLVATTGPVLRRRLWIGCGVLAAGGLLGFAYNAYLSGQSLAQMLLPIHQGAVEFSSVEREGMAAGNYVFLLINLFIPAASLLVVLTDRQRPLRRLLVVGLPVLLVVLFYMSIAFRHRIILLLLTVAAAAYLCRRRRPSPLALLAGGAGIVLLSGFIVLTRNYGRGLDLSQVQDLNVLEIFLGGFSDSGTFFTTGLVIHSFPSTFAYVGLDPLWIALTIPVPRMLWPDKPYPIFLQYFEYLTGTQGQAVPVTGEHYMMAGWLGVIAGGLVIGVIFRAFWEFYRANPRNPLVIALYAVAWALVFPVVNRGYLAQTLMEFFFDLLPLVVFFLVVRKSLLARPAARRATGAVAVQPVAAD